MWSQVVLCMLVGFALASDNPAWNSKHEYIYEIRGRTLSGLVEVADQFAGVFIKGVLKLQPRGSGKLQAMLSDMQYTQVHTILGEGWESDVPEEDLNWKPLSMCTKPFQILIRNSTVDDLIMSKDCKNWEANIIKSIVSLLQLDTNGADIIPSQLHTSPTTEFNAGVFLTMEDTVLGETETLYQIHPIPDHKLLRSDEYARYYEFKEMHRPKGDVIEVLKHEDFTDNEELPLYIVGFGDYITGNDPATNKMGRYFSRDSSGLAILAGDLESYDILYTKSVNTILLSPTINDQQKGAVVSFLEAELSEMKSQGQKIGEVPNPIRLGSLVYTYNRPFSDYNEIQGESWLLLDKLKSKLSENLADLKSVVKQYGPAYFDKAEDETAYYPSLSKAPESPLLPFTVGYEGRSIKKQLNVVKEVLALAKKIGSEMAEEKDQHEKTLERFVTLVSLIRLLDYSELKQVSDALYTAQEEGSAAATWEALISAVSEAGTGPALLSIQDWLSNERIKGRRAGAILSSAANSARQPTFEYLKTFFKMVKTPEVTETWPLNDTSLLAFSNLLRKVCLDGNFSQSEYPEQSFGPFCTKKSMAFIRKDVIPYFGSMLKEAIQNAETHKIHAYIRTLGNIADPRILPIFEPYLEGKRQASQLQRFLMVAVLDKLTETSPEEARAVLFRIYQNVGEHPAVRMIAAVLIIRAAPSPQMLDLMATNTNLENNPHLNAIVKSMIEDLTELEGDEFEYIREAAKSAEPLLTDEEFGLQYGRTYLDAYAIDELNLEYKISKLFIASEDEYIPRAFRYTSRRSLNGLHLKEFNLQGAVTSIPQLSEALLRQTRYYNDLLQQQTLHNKEQESNLWSSQSIAKILKMTANETEGLEGFIGWEVGNGIFQNILGFDNNTIDEFPEYIRDLQKELSKGKKINEFELFNSEEKALAIPTAMGVPFLYSFDTPMLVMVQGDFKAVAEPQLYSHGQIEKPDLLTIESDIRAAIARTTVGRITFIAPFDHQHYISGFVKHWELNLPRLEANIEIDTKKFELRAELELKAENKVNILHYHTRPFTSICDVTNFEPVSSHKNTKEIEPRNMQAFKKVFGKPETGLALELRVSHERQFLHTERVLRVLYKNGLVDGFSELWEDSNVQHSQLDLTLLPQSSTTRKIQLLLKYGQEYIQRAKSHKMDTEWDCDEYEEPSKRQKSLMDLTSSGINSVNVMALDAVVKFEGERSIMYVSSAAVAKSSVDPKSRTRVCFKSSSKGDELQDFEAHFESDSVIPNTNGLDLQYSLKTAPKSDTMMELSFGPTNETQVEIKAQIRHTRSQERVEFLKTLPLYAQCKQEMSQGNNQLYACVNMTMIANLFDNIDIDIQTENISDELEDLVQVAFDALRFSLLPGVEISNKKQPVKEGDVHLEFDFHPDLTYLNYTIQTQNQKTIIENIPVNELLQEVFVAHPVFHLCARLKSFVYGIDTYRDFCTVDQSYVNTFSNKTYKAKLSRNWTVVAQYIPKQAHMEEQEGPVISVYKQLQSQVENMVVLVRRSTLSAKWEDVRIVVSGPYTGFKPIQIDLQPSQKKQKVQVYVNEKEIMVNETLSYDIKYGFIQIYAIPNGEVKVQVSSTFYVLYDGNRLRMSALNGELKDAIRGLCGQFNDQENEDFLTPENCIASDSGKFVTSYEVEGKEGERVRKEFAKDTNECVDKVVPLYVNVVTGPASENDNSGESSEEDSNEQPEEGGHKECWFHQTKYMELSNEICFTLKPLPACRKSCSPHMSLMKLVGVHCLRPTLVTALWKRQIDLGGSPDFSQKEEHKKLTFSVPKSCSL